MRLILVFFLLLVHLGCTTKPQKAAGSKWFDVPKFVNGLVVNMDDKNPKVTKTFILNNTSETKQYAYADSSFWAKELTKLSELDLNKPQFRDEITLNARIKDNNSNLLIDEYLLTGKKDTPFKKLSIYYLKYPLDVRQVYVELKSDNLIAHSETKISLWLNRYNDKLLIDSLQITGEDKTLMQPSRDYHIITKVLL